jgi:hypothetical protein
MKARFRVAIVSGFMLPVSALAATSDLPPPRFTGISLYTYSQRGGFGGVAHPQPKAVISDDQVKTLDSTGRVAMDLNGENLAPDGEGHPRGFVGGYVHIYIRGVNAHNQAGPWKRCNDDDCTTYGGTDLRTIHIGLNPNYYLNEVGAHLQFRTWISWTPDEGDDPNTSRIRHSPWSNIFTVDRFHSSTGLVRVAAPSADADAPTIDKVSPNPIEFGPGHPSDWDVAVTGTSLCSPRLKIILNDDAAHPVAPLGACVAAQVPGRHSAEPQQMVRFSLPPALRKAGAIRLILRNSAGDSGLGVVIVKELTFTRLH